MQARLLAAVTAALCAAVGVLPTAGSSTPMAPMSPTAPSSQGSSMVVAEEQPRDQPWHFGHSSRGAFLAGWSGEHLIAPNGTTTYRREGEAAAVGNWRLCGDMLATASVRIPHADKVSWRNLATGRTGTSSTDYGTNYLGTAPGGILFAQQTPSALDRTSDIVLRAPDGSRRILATVEGFIGGGGALCDTSGIAVLMQVAARGGTPAKEVLSFVRFSGGAMTLSSRTASPTHPTRLLEVNGTSVLWTVGSAYETPVTLYRSDPGAARQTIVTVPIGQEILGAGASPTETLYSVRENIDVTTTSLRSDGTRVVIPGGPQGYATWWPVGSSWRAAGQDGMWSLTGTTASQLWQPPYVMSVGQLAGPNRYETATGIQQGLPRPAVVYIASGLDAPDALAAGPAAVAGQGTVLLTSPTALPATVRSFLTANDPSEVIVLGGTGAVSSSVEAALRSYAPTVRRVAGSDRYSTAAAVSRDRFPAARGGTVVVAAGSSFADSLSGGPAAAAWGGPLLLTASTSLPASTAAEIRRLAPDRIVVVGGTGVVSAEVFAALSGHAATVERLAGANRYETAAAVTTTLYAAGVTGVYIASGETFPDAIVAGTVAARKGLPMLLTTRVSLPTATKNELTRLRPLSATVVGGDGAISDKALWQIYGVSWR